MNTTYHPQTAKFLATVAQNIPEMPGEMMQRWIEDPLGLSKVLKEVLWTQFKMWRTIKLGTGLKSGTDFHKAIEGCGMRVDDWALDIIDRPSFKVATKETEIKLVLVTGAELGLIHGARLNKIYKRAQGLSLNLCPAEVGPQLRYQYEDQPENENILVAMKPIISSDGVPSVFSVSHLGSYFWLGCCGVGDNVDWWLPNQRWVFLAPANS